MCPSLGLRAPHIIFKAYHLCGRTFHELAASQAKDEAGNVFDDPWLFLYAALEVPGASSNVSLYGFSDVLPHFGAEPKQVASLRLQRLARWVSP